MDKDDFDELVKISTAAQNIAESLGQIALVAKLGMLYSEADRTDLIERFRALRDEDHRAYTVLKSDPEDQTLAFEQKMAAAKAMDAFSKEHPLIAQLVLPLRQ